MNSRRIFLLVATACGLFLVSTHSSAVEAAYIHILKNELAETRLHVGEVEAFAGGAVPDELGGGTFGGMSTSTNDIGDGTLTAFGVGNTYPVLGTTDSIQHGAAQQNPDNILQNAGAVWSTNTCTTTAEQVVDRARSSSNSPPKAPAPAPAAIPRMCWCTTSPPSPSRAPSRCSGSPVLACCCAAAARHDH